MDFVPVTRLFYKLRLSNRPATGETVTVTATSSDPSKFGLSLTRYGSPQASLMVTFEDRDADRVCYQGSLRFAHDTASTATSWECYRRIWVINRQQNISTAVKGLLHDQPHGPRAAACAPIQSQASGRMPGPRTDAAGSACALITSELRSRSAPAMAAPTPTEKICQPAGNSG